MSRQFAGWIDSSYNAHSGIAPSIVPGRHSWVGVDIVKSAAVRSTALMLACLASLLLATPAFAQHSTYLLGTAGINGGAQASEGFHYQNV